MSRSVNSRVFEVVGRATWALTKREMRRKAGRAISTRYVAIGALALGVVGIGAIAARSGHGV
ncbi:MAG: hypothetical protein HY827_09475 [Actinobacteria bacterium]|nr:hypothetical protein [Actinomycetota bacterium]